MSRWNLVIACAAFASLCACGKVTLNTENAAPPKEAEPVIRFGKSAELVSGASHGKRTSRGYAVDASVGYVYGKVAGSTSRGYSYSSTVQGQAASEETSQ